MLSFTVTYCMCWVTFHFSPEERNHIWTLGFVYIQRWCLLPAGLPATRLGTFLENRVNDFLRRQNHPEAGEVTVRVVHASDKTVEVKPGMKARYVLSDLGLICFEEEVGGKAIWICLYVAIKKKYCWIQNLVTNQFLTNRYYRSILVVMCCLFHSIKWMCYIWVVCKHLNVKLP